LRIGYQHLAALALAVEQDLVAQRTTTPIQTHSPRTTTEAAATLATAP